MRGKMIGILLVVSGALLMLRKLNGAIPKSITNWEFLLIVAGVTILLIARKKTGKPHLMIWGGIITGLGIHSWGLSHVNEWPEHWSLVPAIIGSSFLLFGGILRKNNKQGTIGSLLLLLGLFAWPGVTEIPGLGRAADTLNTYWPALLVILGLTLIFKKW
ncbi:hypothetical protein [Salinithrix halophila]|uniref:DUF5668 domain-containing protein n=1 Tax=Salinithrix halophila TaxID=1485204 RepID=A0ABV8JR13_9BACL